MSDQQEPGLVDRWRRARAATGDLDLELLYAVVLDFHEGRPSAVAGRCGLGDPDHARTLLRQEQLRRATRRRKANTLMLLFAGAFVVFLLEWL